jgi:transcription termination factor Rho
MLYEPPLPLNVTTDRVLVPQQLIDQFKIPEGATLVGRTRTDRKGTWLDRIESIGGLSPDAFRQRKSFRHLVAVDPNERFQLAKTGETSMRLIDLIAPIGKGTRGLIVAPPKAGKTMLLEEIAKSIRSTEPQTRIVMLLVDERPEEVTHFRRNVEAEVFASSNDQSVQEHMALSELMLAHIRSELECGLDVVVLVDSMTRMSRTFNLGTSGRGRSLSGGLEASALEIPRRFFGLARNIEHGGSVTIIATVLVDTGSRMDQLIFEEFKGTGNSEIVLDRALAEARIFPALNIAASGTRKEHLLYRPDEYERLAVLRRGLADRSPKEAVLALMKLLEKYPSNEELLHNMPVIN